MTVQTPTTRRRRTSAPTEPVTDRGRGAGPTIIAAIAAGALTALAGGGLGLGLALQFDDVIISVTPY
jgi:hypothetical protein